MLLAKRAQRQIESSNRSSDSAHHELVAAASSSSTITVRPMRSAWYMATMLPWMRPGDCNVCVTFQR